MKKAFTMLELVFVLVVAGILAAVMLPQMKSTALREAAIQVVSHIRYTQHLAIINDKYDSSDIDWYKGRWELLFGTSADTNGKIAYSIFADKDNGSGHDTKPNLNELASDPMSSDKYLSGGYSGIIATDDSDSNKKMNLGESYNISSVTLNGGCSGSRISFDHLGRPLKGTFNTYTQSYKNSGTIGLISTTCNVVLISPDGNVTIAIEPETGYTHIL
ncbi:MAG: prepilin-type N-terminal cleavage/methylation domain-containing protein [Sulfurimonas sp.]|jgi:prepilin-type N-terminal cleavage/methylation domain-containing protein